MTYSNDFQTEHKRYFVHTMKITLNSTDFDFMGKINKNPKTFFKIYFLFFCAPQKKKSHIGLEQHDIE